VDRQWEVGFPQLLLYSGDTVWRESVGGLTLLFHAPSPSAVRISNAATTRRVQKRRKFVFGRLKVGRKVIRDMVVTAVVI
jgi:hypothetical protein